MSIMSDELVEATEQRLEAAFGPEDGDDDNLELEAEPTADPEKPAGETTPEPEKELADEPAEEPEPTPEDKGQEPDPAPEQPESGLPDAYYRAAVHQEWTPAEIETFYKSDPDKAIQTFKRMYDSTNKLTAEFARIGRMKSQEAKTPADTPKPGETESVKLDVLKEQYGDDDPLVQTIENLQSQLNEVRAERKDVKPDPAPIQEDSANQVAMEQVVGQFFSASDMTPYSEFYGAVKPGTSLPEQQFKNRMATLELADSILLGAQSLGRNMEVGEALGLAHLTVTEPIREKAIRSDLKAKLVKRSKSLSLEPSSEKVAEPSGPATAGELEAKVAARMAKLFNG